MKASEVIANLQRRFPNEPEYIQAVSQVLGTIEEEYNKHPEFEKANLIERLCIPDRIIQFRVSWVDDKGNVQTNMGYRVSIIFLVRIIRDSLDFCQHLLIILRVMMIT